MRAPTWQSYDPSENSLAFSLAAVVVTLVVGLPAGYAIGRLRFRGRALANLLVLLVIAVPSTVLFVPLYVLIVRDLRQGNTYLGMLLPYAVCPVAVFIFAQFFKSLPSAVFDAARIDGASELKILLRVAVPMSVPAMITAAVVTFIVPTTTSYGRSL